ncbi:hypothetical protein [Actinoplanes sp. NPDC051859]|uniref:hypothetical protein n=1 Tax=Actinoplanes sp. NPDC051859 TaxID=3363909 RepID=UPI0037AA1A1D
MRLSEIAMAAAVTVSVCGVSYATLDSRNGVEAATKAAQRASCRTVQAAIIAYEVQHQTAPTRIAQLKPLVDGDISKYRIVNGRVAGPGC